MEAHWRFLLVGPRSRARTADPRTLASIRLKYEIWPGGPKFDTDSRGLKPKATGLHLVGVRGDTLGSTLALPTSLAEVEGLNSGPKTLACIQLKYEILPAVTSSKRIKLETTGFHLVGVRGDTLGSTLVFPASWAEVEGSNGEPQIFGFYTIKIRNLARGSQVCHEFSGLKAQGNGVTPSRR